MSQPWTQDRLVHAITLLDQLLAISDLSEAEMDAVLGVLLPRLCARSGLEPELFRTIAHATLARILAAGMIRH
jgi:hypothetical protein